MKEFIGLLVAISSLFVDVRGGGHAEYSWRAETPPQESMEIPREGDRVAVALPSPNARQIPERAPGVERPHVNAASALVLEAETGRVLYAENRTTVRPLASLTKLMTALVALDQVGDLETQITITKEDYARGGRMYIYAGDVLTVRDLLYLSLVSSSNDAALALSRAGGLTRTAFVEAMNERAGELRLSRTKFMDPTGLDAGNTSTAEEVARLLHSALAHPFLRNVLSTKEYRFSTADATRRGIAMSTDQLLGKANFGIVGAKTGYIDESGYNFAMQAEGTKGEVLTIIVLGATTESARFTIAEQLVAWAERAWDFGNH